MQKGVAGVLVLSALVLSCAVFAVPESPASEVAPADPWNLFSKEQEIRLGEELAQQVDSHFTATDSETLADYLVRLTRRLTTAGSLEPFPYRTGLIPDDSVDSLALPGGPVYITSGLLRAMGGESDLASILAHQLAHVALRHTARELSRQKRFKIRASFAAASTGQKTLTQSLAEIGLYVDPGSPLYEFDAEEESEARALAAEILAHAGYAPAQAADTFASLQAEASAKRFLNRHPGAATPEEERSRLTVNPDNDPLAGNWRFWRLKRTAARSAGEQGALEEILVFEPPIAEIKPATSREVFITRSYSFSYPQNWVPGKPGRHETLLVAPKSGRIKRSGQEDQIALGVMSGALELGDESADPLQALMRRLPDIRPGLVPSKDQMHVRNPDRDLNGILLEGRSPLTGQRELAWAVATILQDRLIYLLMIAPEQQYSFYQHEFEAIFASIEFKGHPRNGHAEAQNGGPH